MPVTTTRLLMVLLKNLPPAAWRSLALRRQTAYSLFRPFPTNDRGTLAHFGEAQLEEIGLGYRPRGAGDGDRAGRVWLFEVERGRNLALLHGDQAGGQLGGAGASAE